LPTECEWECAARGGVYSDNTSDPWNYTYSGSNNIDEVAWYGMDMYGHTMELGLLAPNTLGLYDMSGNIQEFCWDNNSEDPISASTPVTGPTTGLYNDRYRQIRGGDSFCTSNLCKVFNRRSSSAYVRSSLLLIIGIRLACNSVE
jgi:formylglycine-generating enzyme required for sulfatase activity